MRTSVSVKKVPGAGSPIAKRCAFVGHLRNAENTAAVIGLIGFIAVDYAVVSRNSHYGDDAFLETDSGENYGAEADV